jgi:subfamily B ATP-binding cassette protein MsbA
MGKSVAERGEQARDRRTTKRLFGLLRPHRRTIALALVCMLVLAMLNALQPFLVLTGVGTAREMQEHSGDHGHRLDVLRHIAARFFNVRERPIPFLAVTFIIFFSLQGLFAYSQAVLMEQVGKRVIRDMRNRLYRHSLGLSADFFTHARTGDLMSRLTADILLIEESLLRTFADLFRQPLNVVGLLAAAFILNWKLAIVAFVIVPLVLLPVLGVARRIRRRTVRMQEKLADLASILTETFQGVRVVKAFNMEPYEIERFERANHRLYRIGLRIVRQLNLVRPAIELLGGITVAAVLIVGAGVFRSPIEEILAFIAAVVLLYDPIKKSAALHTKIQMSVAAAGRVFGIMDLTPSVTEKPDAGVLPPIRERIAYENVSFAYEDEPVLRNVSIEIRRGEVVALVGRSGSGKTSLANLLLRFYDPTEGAITVDGTDLREVTLASLREQIGLVTQDVVLFNDTVAANIAYGRPDTPHEAIVEAARMANADRFVRALPAGYETVIGERGVKLSGGEKQRLAIARALLRNPPILVLDEATSALDTESERLVQQAIDRLMEQRTALVIAHRLSTIQHADRIVVLSEGRIVEQGTHPELVEAGGLYRRLYEMQFAL